jgi:hypothetical protein
MFHDNSPAALGADFELSAGAIRIPQEKRGAVAS